CPGFALPERKAESKAFDLVVKIWQDQPAGRRNIGRVVGNQ
ncbi:MAG: hypothetical protein ACI845_003186, partial [Gammaproteobacteria bacterium]